MNFTKLFFIFLRNLSGKFFFFLQTVKKEKLNEKITQEAERGGTPRRDSPRPDNPPDCLDSLLGFWDI